MWPRRAKDNDPPVAGAARAPGGPEDDAVLDAVGAVLRALAAAAPDPEAAARLEAWARHVLVLTPPPGRDEAPPRGRDWPGLGRQVPGEVRAGHEATQRAVDDLQDAVWVAIGGLAQAVERDAAGDALATDQLERLRSAAAASPEELKVAALETVQRLTQVLDDRAERQRRLAEELGQRVDRLRVELEDTRREADVDPLTRLGNRAVFARELPRALQVHALTGEPACLLMVDVDHLKALNDDHGHAVGDAALGAVADALARTFPRRGDVVARYAGDEFAVVLRDARAADGQRLAERLAAAVREVEVAGSDGPLRLSVSIGVAESRLGEPADAWFARADAALYGVKGAGRDGVALAAPEDPAAELPADRLAA